MKTPFLSFTTGGILAILLGFIFVGFSSHHSNQNDEFLKRGLLREGRVVSHQNPGEVSKYSLRLMTNVSPNVAGTDMKIIEVEVKEGDFEKAPVGSLLNLVLIPDNPPRARLAGSAKRNTYRFGYVIASLCFCLGVLLLWLAWRQHHSPRSEPIQEAETSDAPKKIAALSDIMEKQLIKDPTLYDGPFEFSYSAEKTRVELKNGVTVRVSQYRHIAELPKVLADQDLLHVLRTAESDWKLVDTIKTGKLALSHLLKEKHATRADQFFVNGPYLGLLFRSEVENGQWYSFVRGIWKITPLSRTLANLVSGDPNLAKEASFEILNHPDLALIASLAPGLPAIRGALKDTPRTGEHADDRRFITRAADVIEALSQGDCYCQVYAKTSDPPQILIKKGKFTLRDGRKEAKKTKIRCSHCKKNYILTEHAGSYAPYYVWEEKKTKTDPKDESQNQSVFQPATKKQDPPKSSPKAPDQT